MVNNLLKAIPTGIKIARNPVVWGQYSAHTLIVSAVGYTFALYVLLIPIAKFPIAFGDSQQIDFRCEPDFSTGKVVTYARPKLRYIDFL